MAKDYNEIFLEAMSIVSSKLLEEISFDTTIVCEIVDDTDKINGRYIVSTGTTKYEAFSENTNYSMGEQVYVTIPGGDYTKQKIIASRYSADVARTPVAYVAPLGSYVQVTDNLVTNNDVYSILANGPSTMIPIWGVEFTNDAFPPEILNNSIYSAIGLSAEFKTLFANTEMLTGNYGLRLLMKVKDENNNDEIVVGDLDSHDMFGDPYNYFAYLEQSKQFDISKLSTILSLSLVLYQKGNFTHYDTTVNSIQNFPSTYTLFNGVKQKENNICVKNIKISFGENVILIKDDTFKLYTPNKMEYGQSVDPENQKDIYSIWYNKDEDGRFIGFTNGIVDTDYDEDKYRDECETTWKGTTIVDEEVIRLKEILQIYANAEEIRSQLRILESRKNDIDQTLQGLHKNLEAFQLAEGYNSLLDLVDDYQTVLLNALDTSDTNTSIYDLYINFLKDNKTGSIKEAYEKIKEQDNTFNFEDFLFPEDITDKYNNVVAEYENLLVSLGILKISMESLIQVELKTEIKPYWDKTESLLKQYCDYSDKAFDVLESLITASETQLEELNSRFKKNNITTFEEEYNKFQEDNKNRYCIYWYKYQKGYKDENERYAGEYWKRLDPPAPGQPTINPIDNTLYEKNSDIKATVNLDITQPNQKFKAILIFNHVAYASNTLEFTNVNVTSTATPEDDTITIELSTNAKDTYALYSNYYSLINGADALKPRKLMVEYHHADLENTVEKPFEDAWIYWYVPQNVTMIEVDDTKLKSLGFSSLNDIKNKSEEEMSNEMKEFLSQDRSGFNCYYKKINTLPTDLSFEYLIGKTFISNFTNNTIYCKVIKDVYTYEAERVFTFSTFSTCGTDYTLSVAPVGTQTAHTINSGLQLKATFTDYNNEEVLETPGLTWEFIGPNAKLAINGESSLLKVINGDATSCLYNVIKCSAQWDKISENTTANQTLTLSTFYPVAYAADKKYYIEGPTGVIYNSLGSMPSYYEGAFKIFDANNSQEIKNNIKWELKYYDSKGSLYTEDTTYLPKILYCQGSKLQEAGYYLKPLNMYMSKMDIYTVAICLLNDELIFAQPIYIGQNQHGSPMLNSWDETLTIDEENGTILATMLGAGYKDDQNRFHGVVMGDVATTLNDEAVVTTGLYGFHEGAQSFAWKVDGTGFIGKSGHGRIEFNGNNGTITSGNYSSTAGMKIDLETGHIDAYNFKLTSNGVNLNSNPTESEYYINIGNTNNYIRFKNNLEIKSQSFNLSTGDATNGQIIIDSNTPVFKLIKGNDTISFNGSNGLNIAAKNFSLNAGTWDKGKVILSSQGIQESNYPKYYFGVGNKNNWITFSDQGLDVQGKITATSLTLGNGVTVPYGNISGTPDLTIYIAKDGTIGTVADGSTGINISSQGLLQASNAIIYGNIYAGGGAIAGWEINNNSLLKGNVDEENSFCIYSQGTTPSKSFAGSGNKDNWRLTIGRNFGIDSSGNVYCNNLKATSGYFTGDISGASWNGIELVSNYLSYIIDMSFAALNVNVHSVTIDGQTIEYLTTNPTVGTRIGSILGTSAFVTKGGQRFLGWI